MKMQNMLQKRAMVRTVAMLMALTSYSMSPAGPHRAAASRRGGAKAGEEGGGAAERPR